MDLERQAASRSNSSHADDDPDTQGNIAEIVDKNSRKGPSRDRVGYDELSSLEPRVPLEEHMQAGHSATSQSIPQTRQSSIVSQQSLEDFEALQGSTARAPFAKTSNFVAGDDEFCSSLTVDISGTVFERDCSVARPLLTEVLQVKPTKTTIPRDI